MPQDREILRDLARRLRALADQPLMVQRRRLWQGHNHLRPIRPMVLCFPEGSWPELVAEQACLCRDPLLRRWELTLRQRLCTHEVLRDDQVAEPYFDVPWVVEIGDYGVPIPRQQGDRRGSFIWDPPLKDLPRDLEKLRPRRFHVDRQATRQRLELADDLLGDLLRPRIRGQMWWSMGLTQDAVYLVGLEQMMMLMYDDPESLHRLMAFLHDDQKRLIDWAEGEGLLTPNNETNGVGSGGIGLTDELWPPAGSPPRLDQLWGFGESQETVGISPSMFDEFVLPYQVPLLSRFGLNYYGCCEQLEHRIDLVLERIPRMRRVSVAPLANQRVLAEKLGGRYIFCRKADPVPVCVEFNEARIRADVARTLEIAAGGPLELILKDTHTVDHQPWRLSRWVSIAREEIERRFPGAQEPAELAPAMSDSRAPTAGGPDAVAGAS